MQPEALDAVDLQTHFTQVLANQLGHHRANIAEHLAAVLHKQLVAGTHARLVAAVEEAEVVADIVGELGQQLGAKDLVGVLANGIFSTLDHHGGAGITKDEVAVTVTEAHVTGAHFRVDHQHRAGLAQGNGVGRVLDAKGGRRTGHVHVKAKAVDAQGFLYFNRQRRIAARQVGAGDDHAVDISRCAARRFQRLMGSLDSHLAQQRLFVIAALRDIRHHAVYIEDAALVDNKAALDARGLFNKFGAGGSQRLNSAGFNGSRILGVELLDVSVVTGDQLFVADALGGGKQTCSADHDFVHGRSSCGVV